MKNAPCVRFASRIRPKISENPDDSRNNRPPSDRLLRPWMIQNCIVCRSCIRKKIRMLPSFETHRSAMLLQDEANLLKHNNLMLRSERSERLEAWAASDSSFSHIRYQSEGPVIV